MRDIKQHASPNLETWQRQVDALNSLRDIKRVALDAFDLQKRHGGHKDNATAIKTQQTAVKTALASTCFVLRQRDLSRPARVPRAVGERRVDVRGDALKAVSICYFGILGTNCIFIDASRCGEHGGVRIFAIE